jgi:intein-encoded DNA endonuclease-like protein
MGIKYAVNEKFFEAWNPTMAYVLGYWYADGSLEDASYLRGKYIRVTSIDKTTIEKIKRWMSSEHTMVILYPTESHPGKVRYFLRIGSHMLYDSLIKLGLYPNKSLTVRFPKIPENFLRDFVRGYLDGDGCVFLQVATGVHMKKIVKKLSIIFTSGSFDFLMGLCQTLNSKLFLANNKVYKGTGAYQLRYSTKDSLKIFEFLYSDCPVDLFLKRKFNIFRDYYLMRPFRVNQVTARILKDLAT